LCRSPFIIHNKHPPRLQLRVQRLVPPARSTVVQTGDDNTSIYQKNDRRVYNCAVCRTRESETWWKAPRNLSTNSMCDDCGIAWRKYAIKSVRGTEKEKEYLARVQPHSTPEPPTTRSGAAGNKQLAVEKQRREGTPVQGPVAKKLKVFFIFYLPMLHSYPIIGCQWYSHSAEISVLFVQKTRAARANHEMCQVWLHDTWRYGLHRSSVLLFNISIGSIGVPLEDATPDWMCEICSNEQTLESNLVCDPQTC
jgi:hypothetical protein